MDLLIHLTTSQLYRVVYCFLFLSQSDKKIDILDKIDIVISSKYESWSSLLA